MILKYLYRVKRPLSAALVMSFWLSLLFISSISAGLIILCGLFTATNFVFLIQQVLNLNAFRNSFFLRIMASMTIFFAMGLVATWAFPHVFLFINALPFTYTSILLPLSSFTLIFEFYLRIDRRLGADYSLVKLPFSSAARQRLADLLRQPQVPVEALHRIIAREQTAVFAENNLELSKEKRLALIERQKSTVARLPKEAIINDRALYEKHKTLLFAGKSKQELETLDNTQTKLKDKLCAQAKENALEEAKELTTAYQETLRTEEQKFAYAAYREITARTCFTHANCSISYEETLPNSDNKRFIILEKRFTIPKIDSKPAKEYSVPAITRVFEKNAFLEWLATKGSNPENATDKWRNASPYCKHTAQYQYHNYEEVSGHALSMEICDAIDEFLNPELIIIRKPDWKPPVVKKPEQKSKSTANDISVPDYRKTPSVAPNASVAALGIYGQQNQEGNNTRDDEDITYIAQITRIMQDGADSGMSEREISRLIEQIPHPHPYN